MTFPTLRPIMVALTTALIAGACAAALPGYVPEGSTNKTFDRIKPFDGGTLDAAGKYVPSAQERELDCRKLRGSMQIMISRLKDGGRTLEPSAPSAAAQSAMAAVRGKAIMADASTMNRQERARLEAYNGLLVAKGCPALDLSAELKSTGGTPPKSTGGTPPAAPATKTP